MPRLLRNQQSFNAGEISPRLYSRTQIGKYDNAVKTATNFLCLEQGPAFRRQGTEFLGYTKGSGATRLIPFRFTDDAVYILEFGEEYIRFWADGGQVIDPNNLPNPLELSTPYTSAEIENIDYSIFGNKLYLACPTQPPFVLTRNSDTDWELGELSPFPPPTEELGFFPNAILTPGATTGEAVTFTSSTDAFLQGDIGRQIVNENGNGRASIITFTSATSVDADIIEDFDSTDPIAAGDWRLDLSPVVDLTPGGVAPGSIILVDSDQPDSANARNAFSTADIGKYILIHGGVLRILSLNSASQIRCEVLKGLSSLDETGNWTLEEPTWDTTRGFPQAVTFYEERLWFGGTTAEPQTLWGSDVGLFDSFGLGPNDSDSISVDISSSSSNVIRWLAAGRDLTVGTSGTEITVFAPGAGFISPANINQRPRTYYGSGNIQPTLIANEILFIPKTGRKIRSFTYSFEIDNYKAEDLTFLANHFTYGEVPTEFVKVVHANEPESIIFGLLNSGSLLMGCFNREQAVMGWSRLLTDGIIVDIAVVGTQSTDEVWILVNRSISGVSAFHVERLDIGSPYSETSGYADSFLRYDGATTSTISGLSHIEGKEVSVKGNGSKQTNKTVTAGAITLDSPVETAVVGIPYTSTLETLDIDFNFGQGSMLGQTVSWVAPILRVFKSTIPIVNDQYKPSRRPFDLMDNPVPLFSGDLQYGNVDSPRLVISTSEPFCLEISGLTGTVNGDYS